jgi:hypothetical protein
MRTKNKKITPMQKQFANLVAEGMPIDKAYIQCGYKGVKNASKNAHNLMLNQFVIEEITKLQQESTNTSIATLSDCKEKLTSIMNDDDTSRAVIIKAINELSKLSAWETTQIDLNITKDVSELSDEDLMGLL